MDMDLGPELDEEDKAVIRDIFLEKVVPKLQRLGARTGTIACDFAGDKFQNWLIHFRSFRKDFDIVEFEYDPEARTINLGQ